MPFLIALCFVLYANLITGVRQLFRPELSMAQRLAWAYAHVTCCAAGILALGLSIGMSIPGYDGFSSLTDSRWVPLAFFGFSALSAVLFGIKLYQRIRQGTAGHGFVFGMVLWAVLASLYMCFACLDHMAFVRNPDKAGFLNAGVANVCGGDVALFRFEADTAQYRCPTFIALGPSWTIPFVPWPSYSSGQSKELRDRIEAIFANAKTPNEH